MKFGESLRKLGFSRSLYDSCVLVKRQKGKAPTYLLLYVDDMLISGADADEIKMVKAQLKSEFEMKDLRIARRILGIDIVRDRSKKRLWLFQTDRKLEEIQDRESQVYINSIGCSLQVGEKSKG